MKFSLNKLVLAAAAALTLPMAAMAVTPAAGLIGSPHDFATGIRKGVGFLATQQTVDHHTGVATPDATANTVGLCSYCHTPHSALSTALLWNHKLSASTFAWDDDTTSGGTAYASMAPTYKGPSVKCLSCHDGSVAVGDANLYQEASGGIWNTFKMAAGDINQIGAAPGAANMAGNHPVAMPYPYLQATNTYNLIGTGAEVVKTEFVGNPVNQNATFVKLFNDNGTGTIAAGAVANMSGIECSSCHDVHNKATVDDLFLRGKIAGSTAADGYICLQCHIK